MFFTVGHFVKASDGIMFPNRAVIKSPSTLKCHFLFLHPRNPREKSLQNPITIILINPLVLIKGVLINPLFALLGKQGKHKRHTSKYARNSRLNYIYFQCSYLRVSCAKVVVYCNLPIELNRHTPKW